MLVRQQGDLPPWHDHTGRSPFPVPSSLKAAVGAWSPSLTMVSDMTKDHGPSIRDDETYEALRADGASKEKAARIANARAADDQHPSRKGGKAPPYEEWTRDELYERARDLDVEGRSEMTKDALIEALRRR